MKSTSHAHRELELAGLFNKDSDYEGMIGDAVMELMEVFSKQGHSGFSASMTLSIFKRLAEFKPLNPITGDKEEWGDPVDYEGTLQNNRCSALFKGSDGIPYYLDAIIWKDEDGFSFCGSVNLADGTLIKSRQFVRLPFVPKTFVVDVIRVGTEEDSEDSAYVVKDDSQLESVFDYYIRNGNTSSSKT